MHIPVYYCIHHTLSNICVAFNWIHDYLLFSCEYMVHAQYKLLQEKRRTVSLSPISIQTLHFDSVSSPRTLTLRLVSSVVKRRVLYTRTVSLYEIAYQTVNMYWVSSLTTWHHSPHLCPEDHTSVHTQHSTWECHHGAREIYVTQHRGRLTRSKVYYSSATNEWCAVHYRTTWAVQAGACWGLHNPADPVIQTQIIVRESHHTEVSATHWEQAASRSSAHDWKLCVARVCLHEHDKTKPTGTERSNHQKGVPSGTPF